MCHLLNRFFRYSGASLSSFSMLSEPSPSVYSLSAVPAGAHSGEGKPRVIPKSQSLEHIAGADSRQRTERGSSRSRSLCELPLEALNYQTPCPLAFFLERGGGKVRDHDSQNLNSVSVTNQPCLLFYFLEFSSVVQPEDRFAYERYIPAIPFSLAKEIYFLTLQLESDKPVDDFYPVRLFEE